MPMPRTTGLPSADAQDDFVRAHRRARLQRVAAFLRRRPDDVNLILPFDEVVRALGMVGRRALGREVIALDSIVGTVDRARSFDRSFNPSSTDTRPRWERIAEARRRGEAMPPIDVYRIGEAHFVRDGHHRVSVALAQGDEVIEADVTEICTRVGLDRSLRMSDLPLKSHERLFHERVPLPAAAAARIDLHDAARFGRLAEAVEAWGFRYIQHTRQALGREEIARRWFHEEYLPALDVLRESGLLDGFTSETEAYMRLSGQRYELLQTHAWTDEALDRVREARTHG
jgi:hypothetical protein